MDKPDTDLSVVFQCSACGECCSSVNLPIESHKAEALLAKSWVQERLEATDTQLVQADKAHYILPLTDERYCVFLGEDKLCQIHAREGLSLKPTECQRFPFAAIKAESGRQYFDTSSSCKTVANELLQTFKTIVPEAPEDHCAIETSFPDLIKLSAFKSINLQQYQAYRQLIQRIFSDGNTSAVEGLVAARQFIRGKTLKNASDFKRFNLIWSRLVTVFWLRKPYGLVSQWAVLTDGDYFDPKVFGPRSFSLKGHQQVSWPQAADDHNNVLLKGFLLNILNRRVMLAYGHSLESALSVAVIAYFLVQWHAKTLALLQNKQSVDVDDTTLSIRLVDRYYTGHQPRFLEKLRRWAFHRLFQKLLMPF